VSGDTPAWSVYRSDALPALFQPDPSKGRGIALAATDEAMERGWAPEIAIGLARAWSGTGAFWTLVDATLLTPALHRALSGDNETGRSEKLHTLGLPAYVLRVEMSDGSAEYRIYVGAYLDETEALHLSGLLAEQGLADAPLVERRGDALR
jgi:hypothetical protein